MSGFVIAIDGPAGAGKSSVSKLVAQRLGFALVDTGALYRCVALCALDTGADLADDQALGALAGAAEIAFKTEAAINRVFLDDAEVTERIRLPEVSAMASKVSAQPAVRAALLGQQRRLGQKPPGAVLEGRDIGTVVFPDAPLKVFLTATPGERARRRAADLNAAGESVDLVELTAQIAERDERDSSRSHAPLKCADDGLELVSDGLTLDEVVARIVGWAKQRGAA
jgi:cytidylate kinase